MLTTTNIVNGYDEEYATQSYDEVAFLKARDIYYCYVKRLGKNNVVTFKYKRNAKLFHAIADYYDYSEQKKLNSDFVEMSTLINKAYEKVLCDG